MESDRIFELFAFTITAVPARSRVFRAINSPGFSEFHLEPNLDRNVLVR